MPATQIPLTGKIMTTNESVLSARFLLGKPIGKGGFATCYQLIDPLTQEIYAAKHISKSNLSSSQYFNRLYHEINAHKSLTHPNIVTYQFCFETLDHNVYLAMEYCENKSLKELLTMRGTLSDSEVRFYIRQLASALLYLKQNGIVHRDIKPSNILISKEMNIKLCDFGLSELEGCRYNKRNGGTLLYMSPEILEGSEASFDSDIWSVGVIIYKLLTGIEPFYSHSKQKISDKIVKAQFTIPPSAHLSPDATNLLSLLLCKDRHKRITVEQLSKHPFLNVNVPYSLPTSSLLFKCEPMTQPTTPKSSRGSCQFYTADKISTVKNAASLNSTSSTLSKLEEKEISVVHWKAINNFYAYTLSNGSIGVAFSDMSSLIADSTLSKITYATLIKSKGLVATEFLRSNCPVELKPKVDALSLYHSSISVHLGIGSYNKIFAFAAVESKHALILTMSSMQLCLVFRDMENILVPLSCKQDKASYNMSGLDEKHRKRMEYAIQIAEHFSTQITDYF